MGLYGIFPSEGWETLGAILLVFFFVFALIFLVFYILQGIGLMTIAKNMGFKNGWMAWVPIVNFALLGKVAFNNIIVQIALPTLLILSSRYEATVNGKTVFEGGILPFPYNNWVCLIFIALLFVCLYKIYKKLSNRAVVMIIFSILSFGLLAPVFLFAIRKNELIVETKTVVNNTLVPNSVPPTVNTPPVNSPMSNVPTDNQSEQNNQL